MTGAIAFAFARTPRIRFGGGAVRELGRDLSAFGADVLVVADHGFLQTSGHKAEIEAALAAAGLDVRWVEGETGEPSPEWVDAVAAEHRARPPASVAAIGGGSVLDAGKAVSAMILQDGSVVDYLEGVGTGAEPSGRKVPLAAVPTTAGTGSEATKNAVLSRVGEGGFKKSLRHDALVPEIAVIDPELALTCPPAVTAACGMDALTQLLEAYTSTKASPMTDGLVRGAIRCAGSSLVPVATTRGSDVARRADLAYAALVSGIALANAGLGVVHGLASPIGAAFAIPHGVVCGTLVAEASRANVVWLRANDPQGPGLARFADAGRLLGAPAGAAEDAVDHLLDTLDRWTGELAIPPLGAYGVTETDATRLAGAAGLKNNPARLEADDVAAIVRRCVHR